MKVSIIVPVYNVEMYIDRCFDSILAQAYDELECIFVDDASPDDCSRILQSRIDRYSGKIDFTILRHASNKGLSAARNTGTLASTGRYVYYLDSDDELVEGGIERLVEMVWKYPGVDIVQGNTEVPDSDSEYWSITNKPFPEFSANKEWIKARFLIGPRVPVNAWNKLIRRRFLIDNSLFFRDSIIHEDEHWMFYAAKKVSSISFVKEHCYRHYLVSGSIMQSGDARRSLSSWLVILEDLLANVDDVCRSAQRRFILSVLRGNMLKCEDKEEFEGLLAQYRGVVRREFAASAKSLNFVEFVFFGIFCLPPRLFGSSFLKAVSKRWVRLL